MSERVLMKGNEAMAEAAIRAGCRLFFGYPITPQTEVAAYMAKRMPKIGGTYLQAESEVAAINMIYGAAATGKRALTSSSSPGISLKTEGISYIAGSDIPCVIINVQRGGPGLGGIQPSQADYWQATKAPGHGDLHILVYAPSTVQEMVTYIGVAFDKAEQYRMPAMILSDGVLGQMMEPVTLTDDTVINEHDKSWAIDGHQGKRERNIVNSLYLNPQMLNDKVKERFERYETVKENEQIAEEFMTDDADIVIVAYGATSRIVKSAVRTAREQGIKAGMIRPVTLFPFPENAVKKAAKVAKRFLCVEMSMGQMIDDVKLAINCEKPVDFFGTTGGVIPTPADVLDAIKRAKEDM